MSDINRRIYEPGEELEKAVLVGLDTGQTDWPVEESLEELARLAETAGLEVAGTVTQKLDHPNPATFIGKGKVDELASLVKATRAATVIFDDELSPSQQAKLEDLIPHTKVGDRTGLILDIFALHATSREGKLQVELAQMEYLLPRLRGMWSHLDAYAGGGVLTRGPGESQLEVDRRLARKRITDLKRELKKVIASRELQRKSRTGTTPFSVALVGYTNAGKSSLLNRLTGTGTLAHDLLFATLDSLTRKYVLPEGRHVTITDTVGFIQKLPHHLVDAFKSTLDEVGEANLLLQVTDASSDQMVAQMKAVNEVLEDIGAHNVPVLVVFNKVDLLGEDELEVLKGRYPDVLFVSAETGWGIDELISRLVEEAARFDMILNVVIPYEHGELVSLAHEYGTITTERYVEGGTELAFRIPRSLVSRFGPFIVGDAPAEAGTPAQ